MVLLEVHHDDDHPCIYDSRNSMVLLEVKAVLSAVDIYDSRNSMVLLELPEGRYISYLR